MHYTVGLCEACCTVLLLHSLIGWQSKTEEVSSCGCQAVQVEQLSVLTGSRSLQVHEAKPEAVKEAEKV